MGLPMATSVCCQGDALRKRSQRQCLTVLMSYVATLHIWCFREWKVSHGRPDLPEATPLWQSMLSTWLLYTQLIAASGTKRLAFVPTHQDITHSGKVYDVVYHGIPFLSFLKLLPAPKREHAEMPPTWIAFNNCAVKFSVLSWTKLTATTTEERYIASCVCKSQIQIDCQAWTVSTWLCSADSGLHLDNFTSEKSRVTMCHSEVLMEESIPCKCGTPLQGPKPRTWVVPQQHGTQSHLQVDLWFWQCFKKFEGVQTNRGN